MRHHFSAALVAAILPVAGPAYAEDGDEEIVVTATRSPALARRVPAQVTIVGADTALSRGQTTLAQALEDTPGLGIVPSGGAGQQASLFIGGANSYHTLVLFDGLRINDPATPNSSFDFGQDQVGALTRVEIVGGPMSAVFGSDAIGGVVNLIPRRGGEGPFNVRLNVLAGSRQTLAGAAGVDGALGRLRYAFTAEGYSTNGYDLVPARMSTHTGDEDAAGMSTYTGVVDLALTDRLAVDLMVRHREAQADFDPFLYDASFDEYRADDPGLEISQNDLTLARVGGTWQVSDSLSLRTTAGVIKQVREQRDDGLVTDTFSGVRGFADLTLDWRARTVGAFEDVAIVAGVAGEREEIDVAQGFGFPPPAFVTVAEQDQIGAFATAQGRVGIASLTGAVRVDDFEGFGVHTTWRFGASFDIMEASRIYAAYGTSFRAPTLYERFVSFGNPALEPERGESWELGANITLGAFNRADGVELAILHRSTGLEDMIDFGPTFSYANIDRADIEVGEARATLRPAQWLTLNVAYTHTQTVDRTAGAPLLRRPQDAALAAVELAQDNWSARLSWRYVGQRRDFIYGDDGYALGHGDAPSYDVVRLSGSYDLYSQAQLYAAVENALDATYEPINGFAGPAASVLVGLRLMLGSSIRERD